MSPHPAPPTSRSAESAEPSALPPGASANHAFTGTLLGIASAVCYTAANVCLRRLAEENDAVWITCVKTAPTVLVAGLFTCHRAWRGRSISMPGRVLVALLLGALLAQIGNIGFQKSLEIIGLALTVPLMLGTMVIGGAAIGRIWLGELVTLKTACSILMLTAAICVLSFGAHSGSDGARLAEVGQFSTPAILGAVLLASLAGLAYAALGAIIRRVVVGRRVALTPMMLTISSTGLVILITLSYWRIGTEGMLATGKIDWAYMIAAGIFNAIAFFALSEALRLTSFLHVNLLNASQTAMAALAAVIFFDEHITTTLCIGLGLTIAGLLLVRRRRVLTPKVVDPADASGDDGHLTSSGV